MPAPTKNITFNKQEHRGSERGCLPTVTQLISTKPGVCAFRQALRYPLHAGVLPQMVKAWGGWFPISTASLTRCCMWGESWHPDIAALPSTSDFTPAWAQLALSAISPGPSRWMGETATLNALSLGHAERAVSRPGGQVPQLKQKRWEPNSPSRTWASASEDGSPRLSLDVETIWPNFVFWTLL